MARQDPLFPNAAIVARREYRDRVRSPLFLISTVILMGLALLVALSPIGMRYADRQRVDQIVVVADEDRLAAATMATAEGIMNIPPAGADPETWTRPYAFERGVDLAVAEADLARQSIDAILHVFRLPDGRLQVDYRTNGPPDAVQSQLAGFTALSVGILDWTSSLPPGSQLGAFETPVFDMAISSSLARRLM